MAPTIAPGQLSQWGEPAEFSDTKARELAARLELRARADDEVAVREEYIRLLEVAPGERVLDVGCGSGVVTRALAQGVAPNGCVVGLDASPALLGVAQELADEAGLGARVDFQKGDCRELPFPGASFDVVLAATTLAHVRDAERALHEMVRVTRPGGRVGVFDFDGDSLLVAHRDRALTRRIMSAFSDYGAVNGWLVRWLPGLLADLGVVNLRTRGFMPLASGGYYAKLAERAAEIAAEAGAISGDERQRWLEALHAEIAAGRFLGGRLHIFAWGTRQSG